MKSSSEPKKKYDEHYSRFLREAKEVTGKRTPTRNSPPAESKRSVRAEKAGNKRSVRQKTGRDTNETISIPAQSSDLPTASPPTSVSATIPRPGKITFPRVSLLVSPISSVPAPQLSVPAPQTSVPAPQPSTASTATPIPSTMLPAPTNEGPCLGCNLVTTDYEESVAGFCHFFCVTKVLQSRSASAPQLSPHSLARPSGTTSQAPNASPSNSSPNATSNWVISLFSTHASKPTFYQCPFLNPHPRHKSTFSIKSGAFSLLRHMERFHSHILQEFSEASLKNSLSATFLKYSVAVPVKVTLQKSSFIKKPVDNVITSQIYQGLLVIKQHLSFKTLDADSFKKMFSAIPVEPYIPISSHIMKTRLLPIFVTVIEEKIRKILKPCLGISLSFDGWSDITNIHYLGVCAHFLDPEDIYREVIIGVIPIFDELTSNNLAKTIDKLIDQYVDERTIIASTITDGASNVLKASDYHSGNGKIHCIDHILNLIITSALKSIENELKELRTYIKSIRLSHNLKRRFLELQKYLDPADFTETEPLPEDVIDWNIAETEGVIVDDLSSAPTSSGPSEPTSSESTSSESTSSTGTDASPTTPKKILMLLLDCPTRWGSTYIMLERFLKLYPVLIPMEVGKHSIKIPNISRDYLESVRLILQTIYLITKYAQTAKPSAGFIPVWADVILTHFESALTTVQCTEMRTFISEISKEATTRLSHFLNEPCLPLQIAALLPSFGVLPSPKISQTLRDQVWAALQETIFEILNVELSNSSSPVSPSISTSDDDFVDNFDSFQPSTATERILSSSSSSDPTTDLRDKIKFELELLRAYWRKNFTKGKCFQDDQWKILDPLEIWLKDSRLRSLSTIVPAVKVLLSVPGSSARIESAFSHAGIIKSRLRNRMSAQRLQDILYVRLNLPKVYADDTEFVIEVSKHYSPNLPFAPRVRTNNQQFIEIDEDEVIK